MTKITLNEYLKKQKEFYDRHVKSHPEDAFCGSAGKEEMQHVQNLLDNLSDQELKSLIERCGFKNLIDGRENYENLIDEISREDFYREYRQIIESRD